MTSKTLVRFSTFGKADVITERAVGEVRIKECGQPLVELRLPGMAISKTARRLQFDGDNVLYAREEVVRRLERAAESLPQGVGFKIFDAYRPYEYQKLLFDEEYARIKKDNPGLDEEGLRRIVFVSVFPASTDPRKPAPHFTGGAVDLTLVNKQGRELDMGCAYCEFGELMYTNATVEPRQRQNRLILLNAMVGAGFANFPGEWWHFMYGEREWAAYMNLAEGSKLDAMYGGISTPPR